MSLVRAFTTRRTNRPEKLSLPSFVGRSASQRVPAFKGIERSQISGPVALLSSTNVLSYEAPDIIGTKRIAHREISSNSSLSSSSVSGEDSDACSTNKHSSIDLTDASSVDDSAPSTPTSIEPNHLSCYFKLETSSPSIPSRSSSVKSVSYTSLDAPIVPRRAASHSKKAHVQLSRKRSVQRMFIPSRDSTRDSVDIMSGNIIIETPEHCEAPSAHPFSSELEQLDEAVEDFGGAFRDTAADADVCYMEAHGLAQFCASDYMTELNSMHNNIFEEDAALFARAGWI